MKKWKLTGPSKAKSERIDLGLALLSIANQPRQPLSAAEIAAWCDCSAQAISFAEHVALRKLRRAFSGRYRELEHALE